MDYSEALKLFGFTGNFTKEELKKRYLELSKKYHPDLNGDEEMMKKINLAYEVLKNDSFQYKTAKEQINYEELMESLIKYDKLEKKLGTYASKTFYFSNTLEFKYANEIEKVIKNFIGLNP